eukprot:g11764.t1
MNRDNMADLDEEFIDDIYNSYEEETPEVVGPKPGTDDPVASPSSPPTTSESGSKSGRRSNSASSTETSDDEEDEEEEEVDVQFRNKSKKHKSSGWKIASLRIQYISPTDEYPTLSVCFYQEEEEKKF